MLRKKAAELLDITGVGQVKLERYGAEFLDAIALGTSEAVD